MSAKNDKTEADQSLAGRRLRLEQILSELESGEVAIEQVSEKLKEAADLAELIEKDLRSHRASIEVLKKRFNGEE